MRFSPIHARIYAKLQPVTEAVLLCDLRPIIIRLVAGSIRYKNSGDVLASETDEKGRAASVPDARRTASKE